MIFRRELAQLQRAHPDTVRVVHTLTRETAISAPGEDVRSGRITLELLRDSSSASRIR